MPKTIILSNGNLNVGLNEFGLVSDFYFPDNGYNNHTLESDIFHRIGVHVDGQFSWLNDGNWTFEFDYFSDALISKIRALNEKLQIQLEFRDLVASDFDAFLREIRFINLANFQRDFQIFFYQNFAIDAGRHLADTVQFLPEKSAILHYRGKRAFVISAEMKSAGVLGEVQFSNFSQHTVGLFGIENKLGSWLDAEDGALSGCNVEHGQTDSVFGFDFSISAGGNSIFQYSISCADGHDLAFLNSAKLRRENFHKVIEKTHVFWQKWLSPVVKNSQKLPKKYRKNFIQSAMIVKSHISKTGAVIASNDSEMLRHARDDYSYCWPRDALFAIWPLIRLGYKDEALNFFEFCEKVINSDGCFSQKYLPNGEKGPSWHAYFHSDGEKSLPIQLDETAGILFLLAQYHSKYRNIDHLSRFYYSLIRPMANFLSNFLGENNLPKANYELWEMDFLTTTYSTSLAYSALASASEIAREIGKVKDAYAWRNVASKMRISAQKELFGFENGYFYRGIWPSGEKDSTLDASSFYGSFMFGLFDLGGAEISQSLKTLENRFSADEKIGIPRFVGDVYYLENGESSPNIWIISSLWRAEYYLAIGEKAKAEEILDWVCERASSAGILPEQVSPKDFSWRSVAPLTWSQAELISAMLDLIALQD